MNFKQTSMLPTTAFLQNKKAKQEIHLIYDAMADKYSHMFADSRNPRQ